MATSLETKSSLDPRGHRQAFSPPWGTTAWTQSSFYVLFAFELFAFLSAFWSFVVLQKTFPSVHDTQLVSSWFWIAFAAASFGTGYFVLARNANRRGKHELATRLLSIALAAGVVMLGVFGVLICRVTTNDPYFLDVSTYYQTTPTTAAVPETIGAGDAAKGKTLFAATCATCHGPTGDGIANNAPSLRASEFLKASNTAVVASLVRNGRSATDPANKTGKVMPARGGNPFLDEAKIADLAAFLKNLDAQVVEVSAGGADAKSIVQLSRWVLPAVEEKYSGLVNVASNSLNSSARADYKTQWGAFVQRRYQTWLSCLFIWGTTVLAFHFIWVMGMACGVVLYRELRIDEARQSRLFSQSFLYWVIGVVALSIWLFIFVWFG